MQVTPEELAKSNTEHGHQCALFCWAQQNLAKYPELEWMFAIPNGGARGNDERSCIIRGGSMKAEGVKAGVFDILLPVGKYGMHGLFIEMKRPETKTQKAGTSSVDQKKFSVAMRANGYGTCICYSWIEAREIILQYLA